MLRFFRAFSTLGLLLGPAACSVYPLPEDVAGVDSDQIATIVRCQTRDAVRASILESIAGSTSPIVFQGQSPAELVGRLTADPEYFHDLQWAAFSPDLSKPFIFYKDVSISYDFTIDSTEMNSAGVTAGVLRQLPIGSNTLGLTARNDRTREVKRHFRAFDSFDSLARLLPERICRKVMPQGPDYVYPIAGLVKIRSLVRSFLFANQFGNLAGDNNDYTTAQMADTLTFTTKNTANVDPTFARNPVLNAVVPASVAVVLDNNRQDVHTVLILLRLPPSRTGLPRFDELGRIALDRKEAQKAIASDALDRQRSFNAQDALVQLGSNVSKLTP